MNKTKLALILMAFTLLITGCSAKNSTKNTSTSGKGRYMEESVTLPENISDDATIQLKKINGIPCLYVYTQKDYCTITRYLMQEDGTWSEDTPTWLKNLNLPSNTIIQNIFTDTTGNQYLFYTEVADEFYKAGLLCSSDGSTYETLSPEGWDVKDEEYGIYYCPEQVNILEDGTLVAMFYDGEIDFYDANTMKKKDSTTGTKHSNTILSVLDNSVIVGEMDSNNYSFLGIDIYDTADANKMNSYAYKAVINSSNYLDINEDKDILLSNADGIHLLEKGTSLWQTIVDGTLNSLSMGNLWCTGFITAKDNEFYVLLSSNQGYELKKYYFDETVNTVPLQELTIYSLKDNSTLRQAASVFQQSHPDVKVTITVAMSNDEYEDATDAVKADYIKALNTELLAGKGSDILVLDDLPVESLIEKGILSDLSDVIVPMLDNGELYTNIINNYYKDNRIYSVPARFNLPLLLSRDLNAHNLVDLKSLASYVKEHPNKNLFGMSSIKDFITTYSQYLPSRIFDTNGHINREKLITVLNELKDISNGYELVNSYPEDTFRADGAWELASKVQLAITTSSGFLDSMFPLGFVSYTNGSFTAFDQSILPSFVIGINHNSDKQELSKEFMALALSKEIGVNDFYDGYSINKKALTICSQTDRSDYISASDIENEDGSYSSIIFGVLSEDQINNLVNACTNVTKIASSDEQITASLYDVAENLLNGIMSAEDAADYIIKNTEIYLAE